MKGIYMPEIQLEEEWKEIFTPLNIKDYPHKECLRILIVQSRKRRMVNDQTIKKLLSTVEGSWFKHLTWSTQRSEKSVPAALYMKGFLFHYNKEVLDRRGKRPIYCYRCQVLMKEAANEKMKSTAEAIVLIGSIKDALLIYSKKNDYVFPASKLSINSPYKYIIGF